MLADGAMYLTLAYLNIIAFVSWLMVDGCVLGSARLDSELPTANTWGESKAFRTVGTAQNHKKNVKHTNGLHSAHSVCGSRSDR